MDLDRAKIRAFCDKMRSYPCKKSIANKSGTLSDRTVGGIHATLCSVLSDAMEEGYIQSNPAWRAYKPKSKKKDIYAADEEMAKKLIAALEDCSIKHETYFKLILATGMRRGECCGLTWDDIDWNAGTIHIHRNVVVLPGGRFW